MSYGPVQLRDADAQGFLSSHHHGSVICNGARETVGPARGIRCSDISRRGHSLLRGDEHVHGESTRKIHLQDMGSRSNDAATTMLCSYLCQNGP